MDYENQRTTALSSTLIPRVDTMGDLCSIIPTTIAISGGLRIRLCRDLKRVFELDPVIRSLRPLARSVEPRLRRLHPTNTGLSQKRLDNIKASVRRAIRHFFEHDSNDADRSGLRGTWSSLYALLPLQCPARILLGRFARYCQKVGVAPEQVCKETLVGYAVYLEDVVGEENPKASVRGVVAHWNASARMVGWPQNKLDHDLPKRPELAIREETMGPALAGQLRDYLHFLEFGGTPGQERDPFDLPTEDDWRLKRKPKLFRPARTTTLRNQYYALRRAIGLLATVSKVEPSAISLKDLTAGQNASAILKEYRRQLGNRAAPPACETMVYALVKLGRYFEVDAKTQWQLDALCQSVCEIARKSDNSSGPSRMTAKNLERLRQIGPNQVRALYQLPAILLERAAIRIRNGSATLKDMIDAQVAVAVAILLHVPLRAANTVSIEIGKQLILPPLDSEYSILNFEFEVVKNKQTLHFRLPPDVTTLIRMYMTEIQPHFDRTNRSLALFPGTENLHKSAGNLGRQIVSRIQKAIGVKMNQHLFRHFVALLFLRRNPGQYAAVQRLLGHQHLSTTMSYYTGAEIDALLEHISTSMAAFKLEMGLAPDNMSLIVDVPKRRLKVKRDLIVKSTALRKGYFSRIEANSVVDRPILLGQGNVGLPL
jgi:hypothetical protein